MSSKDPSKVKHEFNKKQTKKEKKVHLGLELREQEKPAKLRMIRDKQRKQERTHKRKEGRECKMAPLDDDVPCMGNGSDRCKELSGGPKGTTAQENDNIIDVKQKLSSLSIKP